MSVLICVPTYETIAPETFKSIYNQIEAEGQGRPMFDFVSGYGCAYARNKCAMEAMRCNADYLMFVDSDIQLPLDALSKLVECNADIALGVYPRRLTATGQTEVFLPGSYNFDDSNNLNLKFLPGPEDNPIIDAKGGGLGCALIKTSLFGKIKYPYFRYVEYEDGNVLSEDNYFCWQAAEQANATIKCHTQVRCLHRNVTWHSE